MPPNDLPFGKLPAPLLEELINRLPTQAEDIVQGPGIGLDCAVIQVGERLLVIKSDPITFTSEEIGWYLVQVNVNDIATTGALPRWLMVTILLPSAGARKQAVEITAQLQNACALFDLTVIGGHTEVTRGIDRPILVGTMIGEVAPEKLVSPRGALPGDRLLITKGVPIEATAILGKEFAGRLLEPEVGLSQPELEAAQQFLYEPGISVLQDARAALEAGGVHAMHDPTEGGIYAAVWEMAAACGLSIRIEPKKIPVYPLSRRICEGLGLDPLGAIASGALLIAAAPDRSQAVIDSLTRAGIACTEIGFFEDEGGEPRVLSGFSAGATLFPRQEQDEVTRLFQPAPI